MPHAAKIFVSLGVMVALPILAYKAPEAAAGLTGITGVAGIFKWLRRD